MASSVSVIDRHVIGTNPQELCNKISDLSSSVKADIDGLSGTNFYVRGATTAALPACTYSTTAKTLTGNANGALAAQDGLTLVAGERLLVKNQATATQNGIYVVTSAGATGAPFVLTRASDFFVTADAVAGRLVIVAEGTVNADSGFILTTDAPISLDGSNLTFTKAFTSRSLTGGQQSFQVAGGATALAEIAMWSPSFAGVVTSVKFIPTAASTPASGSNSQALAVTAYDGVGGGGQAVASASIANATPTAAFQPFDLGTVTNGVFAAGNVFSVKSTLTGTATLPSGTLFINYTRY